MKSVIQSNAMLCMKRSLFFILFFLFIGSFSYGQILKDWHGKWSGTMFIYGRGQLRDSVNVVLTISPINDSTLIWRTDYISKTQPPVTKDYKMKRIDPVKGIYGTDEGGGLVLTNYLVDNTLYSVFETSGILLTATYHLKEDCIDFEVTSGKKDTISVLDVFNYSVGSVQKVHLVRQPETLAKVDVANEPIYFLDNIKISKEAMEKIDPAKIESVNVFKGDEAIRKFGPEGRNGVVVIKIKSLR